MKKRVTSCQALGASSKRVISCQALGASSKTQCTTLATSAQRLAPRASRRGILLLVVLSMLTLFLLIGTAFIVSANHYRKTLKTFAKATEASNSTIDQGNLLDEVINQIVRDTNNQNSTLRFHSLLRDMYGNDGLMAEINFVAWASVDPANTDPLISNPTQGQLLQFLLDPTTVTDQFGISLNSLNANNNAYNGLVLTFLDGPARGQSVRIVGHIPVQISPGVFNARLRVMSPRKADGSNIVAADFADLNASRILINGRPFNGTGAGYNAIAVANSARLSARESLLSSDDFATLSNYFPVALMPNGAFFNPQNVRPADYLGGTNPAGTTQLDVWNNLNANQQRLLNSFNFGGLGGSDESYDVADFQNMMLAMLPVGPSETVLPGQPGTWPANPPPSLGNMIIPSAHRPALLHYWASLPAFKTMPADPVTASLLGNQANVALLRKILLRPNWHDHPNFTGSNPDFANLGNNQDKLTRMIYGPWDVDNDNDGIRDSIFVDVGLPVMENADGRLVKPLAAIMVLDMDGRLNINAHGSEDIANAIPAMRPPTQTVAGGVSTGDLARGQGYGPAEISLGPLMPFDSGGSLSLREQRWKWYKRFFRGAIAGRRIVPDVNSNVDIAAVDPRLNFARRQIGKLGQDNGATFLPGYMGFDISAQLKMQGVPLLANDQAAPFEVLGNYATPPDFKGRYAMPALNELGQPVYEAMGDLPQVSDSPALAAARRLRMDTPYELDLSLGAARGDSQTAPDGPYTMAELERILRAYDPDAGTLSSRIWKLAAEFKPNAAATTPNLTALNLWRTTLTTDSYDLPVPSVVVPGWMVLGKDKMANTKDDYVRRMGKPAVGATFADLIEYRLRDELDIDTDPSVTPAQPTPAQLDTIRQRMAKLLPPDLADGLRLDINRPLGNGRDDNDNGVVDEPGEDEGAFWASTATQLDAFTEPDNDTSDGTRFTGLFRDDSLLLRDYVLDGMGVPDRDWNNDGMIDLNDTFEESKFARGTDGDPNGTNGQIDTLSERVAVHNLRRQMLARDMYLLAMTLVDPLPIPTAGITDPGYLERRAQRARKLAQWAINVVDFRDPDNIMTAFEYDANPFDGWAPDGSMATQDDIYGADNKIGGVADSTNEDQGGLVWGSERPELLITETLGWHDRATENTGSEDPANNEDEDPLINDDDRGTVPLNANETTKLPDSDYDQRLRPKGAAFVELYCPWPENIATNEDLHNIGEDVSDIDNDGDVNEILDFGVNLAAMSATSRSPEPDGSGGFRSPCWRLMMYKDGGPGMDPDSHEVKLRPRLPDRSVYFTGFDPEYPQPMRYLEARRAHPDVSDTARYVNDGVAFFNDQSIPALAVSTVLPGGYMVVGAGEGSGAGPYVSKLSSPTGSVAYSAQGISLDPSGIVKMGVPITDPAGFQVRADATVAIINQAINTTSGMAEERRFTFSEPANGYPDRVEGSRWDPSKGTSGAYVPTVDIPLDDQRALFEKKTLGDIPQGTGGRLQAKKRSELNDGEIRLTLPGFRQGRGFAGNKRKAGALGRDIEMSSRTIPGFKWVYLQRLANPLLPWNPEPFLPDGTTDTPGYQATLAVNPYMTVDSMGANVTVYTGVSEEERRVNPAKPKDPILRFRNRIPIDTLSSLQRGRSNNPLKPSDLDGLVQLQEFFQERPDTKVVALLNSSKPNEVVMNLWNPEALGYINGTVAGVWKNEAGSASNGVGAPGSNFRGIPDHTLGFLNEPFRAAGSNPNEPKSPLSWFTWNNRPYANGGEFLQVPAYSSSQLLSAYSMRDDGDTTKPSDPLEELYEEEVDLTHRRKLSNGSRWDKLLDLKTDGSYGHLLNFFRTDNLTDLGETLTPEKARIAGMYRLLDYIHVPSPFVKSETWLNPVSFGSNLNVTSVDDPRYQRQPPFNRIAEYREPGRVNLNTIVSGDVWDGGLLHRELEDPALPWDPVNNNYLESWTRDRLPSSSTNPLIYGHAGPKFTSNRTTENNIVSSRRGYGTPRSSMLLLDKDTPTFFENPFRAADGVDLVPIDLMLLDFRNERRTNVHATLLRGDKNIRSGDEGTLLAANTNNDSDFNEANRNSYFRYQPISRLSSMTTTRSNVYAVWVTIGFFEVEEFDQGNPDHQTILARYGSNAGTLADAQTDPLFNKVYPEGYMLTKEAGSDTGDIRRVREFAMIDRTVPVAFEPGQNHNVDKAIRLRRRIE